MISTTETTNTALSEAQAKIQNIQTSIINGDKSLTAKDLAGAKAELEFIQLQEEAREIIKQSNAEAERKTTLLNLQKRLKVIADSRKTVNSKFAEFEKSLANYLTAATTYQNNLNDIRAALREAAMYPGEQVAIIGGVAPGQSYFGIQITDMRRKLEIGSTGAENILPEQEIKPLIEKSLGEYAKNF
jgi:F0F1-type ATP synthase membrane subunit b/b'